MQSPSWLSGLLERLGWSSAPMTDPDPTQAAPFLRAVLDAPDADAPRLIFADWLDEQGTPACSARAELIRVQCALATTDEADPCWPDLARRERVLVRRYGRFWAWPFRPLVRGRTYRRGFVEVVRIPVGEFRRAIPVVRDWTPLRGVELTPIAPIDSSDLLAQQTQDVYSMLESPQLAALESLNVASNFLGEFGVRAITHSKNAENLVSLGLSDNQLTEEDVRVLMNCAWLRRLAELDLSFNPINEHGAYRLAHSPLSAGLRVLDLSGCLIHEAGLRNLLDSPHLIGLRSLKLAYQRLSDEAARVIATSPNSASLVHLDLSHNRLTAEGARALAESPHLGNLRVLDVRRNAIYHAAGGRAVAALRRRFGAGVRWV